MQQILLVTQTKLTDLTPAKLQTLSPQLRRAARYVVEHPEEIATRSQRYIAEAASLSAPTLTRLAQAIGYDSYDDLRETCRVQMVHKQTVLAEKAKALVTSDPDEASFAARHAAASIRNVEAFIGTLDQTELDAAARLIATARSVALLGVMSGRPIVDYAMYIANMSLSGWLVPGRNGQGMASDMAELGAQDVCIVFSIEPYSARAVALAQSARDLDVPLIALTDNHLSPITEHARHSFYIGTQSPQFFPSHVAAMVFFEAIIGMVIQIKGPTAQKKIAAVERQNHKLNEYWQDTPATN